MNSRDGTIDEPVELDSLTRQDKQVFPDDAYKQFQLGMLLTEIRTNPAMLADDPVTRRHACELYHDPRARLQLEIVLREHHLFPPDVWAACFAPDPVPQRKFVRAAKTPQVPRPTTSAIDTVDALALLQEKWHATITGVIRHGIEQPTWYLTMGGRTIALGTTRQLQDQTHVRGVLFEATGQMVPRVPASHSEEWDMLLEAMAQVAVLIDAPDLTMEGQASELVLCYLETQYYSFAEDFETDEWEACARKNMPFRTGDRIYIHARHFHGHYVHLMAPGISYQQCLEYLHVLKARNVQVTVNTPPRTTRSYWRLPQDWMETTIGPQATEDDVVHNN